MLRFEELNIKGCFEIQNFFAEDDRGCFVKTYHADTLLKNKLDFEIRESYYSISRKDVIRGMHFQLPPHDHHKMVYCLKGRVLDVILDLRKSSSTYLQLASLELEEKKSSVFIPKGCAHGFLSLEDESIMVYNVSTVYAQEADSGIAWNSFGFNWPVQDPVLSKRDQEFIQLKAFESPFS